MQFTVNTLHWILPHNFKKSIYVKLHTWVVYNFILFSNSWSSCQATCEIPKVQVYHSITFRCKMSRLSKVQPVITIPHKCRSCSNEMCFICCPPNATSKCKNVFHERQLPRMQTESYNTTYKSANYVMKYNCQDGEAVCITHHSSSCYLL